MIVTLSDGQIIDTNWDVEELKNHHNMLRCHTSIGNAYPIVVIIGIKNDVNWVNVHFKHDKKTMTDIIEDRGDFNDEYRMWKKPFFSFRKTKQTEGKA